MCVVRFTTCPNCLEKNYLKPNICEPFVCPIIFVRQQFEILCQVCYVIKYGKPDMTRFTSKGYMLRNRFVKYTYPIRKNKTRRYFKKKNGKWIEVQKMRW